METEIKLGHRPPQTPENLALTAIDSFPKPTDAQAFEKWCQLKALNGLRQRYSNLPPEDRYSPLTEPQEVQIQVEQTVVFPASGSIDFSSDFKQLDHLHAELGMQPGQRVAHDIAMDRSRYLLAETAEEKQAVKQGIKNGMEKTLYERAYTAKSTVVYSQDSAGRIYHSEHPGESFDVVLARGVEYSRDNKFVDLEREEQEFEGWKEIMTILFDPKTPAGNKAVSISGSGLKKKSAFTDNFVDIYTKTIDPETKKVVVTMTRFASATSYEEYKKIAAGLDDNYFDQPTQDESIDVYFKRHPIFIDSKTDLRDAKQLFSQEFKKQARATEEEKTVSYLEECKLFILHYADTVCAKFLNPEQVIKTFRAALNKFDELKEGTVQTGHKFVNKVFSLGRRIVSTMNDFLEEVDRLGGQPIRAMMVGCGFSGDFSVGGAVRSIGSLISSAVSGIGGGLSSRDKDYCIRCGACGEEIKCVVRKGETCPKCKATRQC